MNQPLDRRAPITIKPPRGKSFGYKPKYWTLEGFLEKEPRKKSVSLEAKEEKAVKMEKKRKILEV